MNTAMPSPISLLYGVEAYPKSFVPKHSSLKCSDKPSGSRPNIRVLNPAGNTSQNSDVKSTYKTGRPASDFGHLTVLNYRLIKGVFGKNG